jgi:hypothetical protein
MTHDFHRYIASSLEKRLKDRRVVIFYDAGREFEPFIEELLPVGQGHGGLPRAFVGETLTWMARYGGSYFSLRHAIEPVVSADSPEPMIIYLPGVRRDPKMSVLMELEKAGDCYEPSLKRLALNELRKHYSDGQIDEMLAPDSLGYQHIVQYLKDSGGAGGSLLKLVLGDGKSEALLARWLGDASYDAQLKDKGATEELLSLVQTRLGLELSDDLELGKARRQVARYVLTNEFRSDLTCSPPEPLAIVPSPSSDDVLQRSRDVAGLLRSDASSAYPALADEVETELQLPTLGIPATDLGTIDTFRFEERMLLGHAAGLLADGQHEKTLEIVKGRGRSFWIDQDIARLAQWEACRLAAELDRQVAVVHTTLDRAGKKAADWIKEYSRPDGWHQADRAQRLLETWIAQMEDEPEAALESAITGVRVRYEQMLSAMADRFSGILAESGWTTSGALHQTRIFSKEIQPRQGRVAYFLADAFRFEMAADLVEQLDGAADVRVQPGVTALPTITPVGMAALMPGAASSFSVIEHKGKVMGAVGETRLGSVQERTKHFKASVPDSADIDIGTLLQKSAKSVEKKIGATKLLVVRSQSIDGLGEMDGGLLARQVMATAVGNLARAVRKLARLGFEHFVITADHGYQFSYRKDQDMVLDKPGGETVDLHRRCWAGRGGQTPGGCLRVTGPELGYRTDLDFVFPRALGVFPAGGSLAFHHGGISLQELVIPVVTFRMKVETDSAPKGPKISFEGIPETLANRTFGLVLKLDADLFSDAPISVSVVLLSDGQEVGRAGMAIDAAFDRSTATVQVTPGKVVNLAMILTREDCTSLRVVALDPKTDAVLAQSNDISVKLGM